MITLKGFKGSGRLVINKYHTVILKATLKDFPEVLPGEFSFEVLVGDKNSKGLLKWKIQCADSGVFYFLPGFAALQTLTVEPGNYTSFEMRNLLLAKVRTQDFEYHQA